MGTKYGEVTTDHVLFICAGAFHAAKPSDLLAELQGRLPVRVELKGLGADELHRVLTEPKSNMIAQQAALLAAEGVELAFEDDAVRAVADAAEEANRMLDNIGARRLHTVLGARRGWWGVGFGVGGGWGPLMDLLLRNASCRVLANTPSLPLKHTFIYTHHVT